MNASKLLSPEPQDAKVTLSLLQTSILKLKNLEKKYKDPLASSAHSLLPIQITQSLPETHS